MLRAIVSTVAAGFALLLLGDALAAQSPQTPLAGSAIPQFVQPLPKLSVAPQNGTIRTVSGDQPLTLRMCEFQANVLPPGAIAPGVTTPTWVWGYVTDATCPPTTEVRDTYTGPVIVATRGTPTQVTFVNELGSAKTTNVLAYRYGTDPTLHWADPLGGEDNMCAMDSMAMKIPAPGSMCAQNYEGPVPAVPHLHGGEVPAQLDGSPGSWFTSDGQIRGHAYYSREVASLPALPNPKFPAGTIVRNTADGLLYRAAASAWVQHTGPANFSVFRYPNVQEAGPLWFHDHTLGATRLNVYAGLAGGYLLTDPAQVLPANLPGPAEIVPLVIQDRMFDTQGQLFLPNDSAGGLLYALNPEHPYWVPEFVGDVIVVNGKAWPYLDVQAKRYRFLLINGSNARTYELALVNQASGGNGPAIWVIGNDGGYLDAPVKLDPALGQKLVVMPGERYELIVDFGGLRPGTQLLLRNTAKAPYPAGASPKGSTVGRIMQFRVAAANGADASYNPASGTPLRSTGQKIIRLTASATGTLAAGVTPQTIRALTLNEVMGMPMTYVNPVTGALTAYPGGPLEILVNNTKWSGESPRNMMSDYGDFVPITLGETTTYYSELPQEGDTELWEIVNLTADAHPIHLHLVQFQLLNRQAFDVRKYTAAYGLAFPNATVPASDPMYDAWKGCTGGVFCPGFGPPLKYANGATRLVGTAPVPLVGGNPDVTPFLQGPVRVPGAQESGWKDTVMAPPGQVTRFVVRWAPADKAVSAKPTAQHSFAFDPSSDIGYVWHCHIIDHEDNEMMRPDVIQPNPLGPVLQNRVYKQGVDY